MSSTTEHVSPEQGTSEHTQPGNARGWPSRWSPHRIRRRLLSRSSDGRAGDGRERKLAAHVLATTPRGDLDAVIDAIDRFAYETAFLINIGDDKGALLESTVREEGPERLLELGTYCGYSALRMARAMSPTAHVWSVEPSRTTARIAARLWEHAGVGDRVTGLVGRLDDGGATLRRLADEQPFDLVFLDHDKDAYLADLRRLLDRRALRAGSLVVADNVLTPGAPDYRAYMGEHEGALWRTAEQPTHLEYRPEIPDLMLMSRYRPAG